MLQKLILKADFAKIMCFKTFLFFVSLSALGTVQTLIIVATKHIKHKMKHQAVMFCNQ